MEKAYSLSEPRLLVTLVEVGSEFNLLGKPQRAAGMFDLGKKFREQMQPGGLPIFVRRKPVATKEEIIAFMASDFPQSKSTVEQVGNRSSLVRRKIHFDDLRPGGTISGPVLMEVADVALYVAILGEIGIVPLAVTTNLNIHFLRRPLPEQDILGVCKLLKVGRSLVVGEVSIRSEGNQEAVAHAVGTYSIPTSR